MHHIAINSATQKKKTCTDPYHVSGPVIGTGDIIKMAKFSGQRTMAWEMKFPLQLAETLAAPTKPTYPAHLSLGI